VRNTIVARWATEYERRMDELGIEQQQPDEQQR
jgi:hypothetical protein